MKNFNFEDKVKKLYSIDSKEEKVKLVWMWIKQNQISVQQFQQLIDDDVLKYNFISDVE